MDFVFARQMLTGVSSFSSDGVSLSYTDYISLLQHYSYKYTLKFHTTQYSNHTKTTILKYIHNIDWVSFVKIGAWNVSLEKN